jgi:hypothetical protein
MRTFRTLSILLLFAGAAVSAPASQPKTPKEEPCAVEVDFAPLAPVTETATYKLHITARCESGTSYKDTFGVTNGFRLSGVIRGVVDSLSRNAERFTRLPATLRAAQPRGMGKSFCAPT